MPRIAIIQPEQSYTFSDYFKLNFAPQDILAYFGVSLQRTEQYEVFSQTFVLSMTSSRR
jgi:hypothetical protein